MRRETRSVNVLADLIEATSQKYPNVTFDLVTGTARCIERADGSWSDGCCTASGAPVDVGKYEFVLPLSPSFRRTNSYFPTSTGSRSSAASSDHDPSALSIHLLFQVTESNVTLNILKVSIPVSAEHSSRDAHLSASDCHPSIVLPALQFFFCLIVLKCFFCPAALLIPSVRFSLVPLSNRITPSSSSIWTADGKVGCVICSISAAADVFFPCYG